MILSNSLEAKEALDLLTSLQEKFVEKLNTLSKIYGKNKKFEKINWLRDDGLHGGGNRYEARDNHMFNTASVNISHIHYDDLKDKKLQSASAISSIIHPKNPKLPSIHIHISLTQIKNEKAYWRIMADLNPSIVFDEDKKQFIKALEELSLKYFDEGKEQGDKYFNIPALNKHRGIAHFYLEDFKSKEKKDDINFAKNFGEGIIDTYTDILKKALKTRQEFSVFDIKEQLVYHTLYLFQVLTLDRGTTSGLLVHNQNDLGIMGSLPKYIDKKLLESWISKVEKPQDKLIQNILENINTQGLIDENTKKKLADVIRTHYQRYPEAIKLQASGNTIPPTIRNHK